MDKPSTSGFFNSDTVVNSASLNLSLHNKLNALNDNEEVEDDDIEEVEVDENERLQLQKVTSFVEAAYQRVEEFSKQHPYQLGPTSGAASKSSSCASTVHHGTSLPESLDGGTTEIEEIKNLPPSFESALRINQTLQRRLTATLNRLEKTLQQNLLKQAQLREDEEEQGLIISNDRDSREYRNKYFVRPSSFAFPYFKDRSGMPAPMNLDTKFKVDHGYLDLYSTRLRTWLTSEQNSLVKEIHKEWKNKLLNDWKISLKGAERKLKNDSITEDERIKIESEIQTCQNHITFFTNVSADKIDIPREAKLDWDKISAQTFDGHRSTEECQLIWENFLHPDINQKAWTEDEDIEIQEAVLGCEPVKPDWEKIAANLSSGRTAFQIMQRWVSFIRPTIQPARWTAEGSKKLEDTVNMLRVGNHIPWAQVCQHLTGYTKVQLQSRWRNINPDQSKGPFSCEEDFVLIKGLYKFGINFDVIAYFLPGRNKVQVRDRFKRAILPGLTSQPWTLKEDKKIIDNCSLESQHWRMMASLMPRRDTCQIRLRFYILHFWQSITKDKKLPPPLFPLSMTEKPSEVKKLREKIVNLNPDVKIFLDSLQINMEGLKKVNLSEARRNAIYDKNKPEVLAKFLEEKNDEPPKPKLVRKRKRGRYGPRTISWPDKALTEFFLPGRTTSSKELNLEDDALCDNFHLISQALQLKVGKRVTECDTSALENHVNVDYKDASLVNTTLVEHHEIKEYGDECLCCSSQNADIIPLLPPNLSTVGAFRSLLLHKPKLEEMAAKEFLLYEVPRSQLHKLGEKPKTLNEKKVSPKLEITEDCLEEFDRNEDEETNETEVNSSDKQRGKRKAATMANIVNYVFSKESQKPVLLKDPVVSKEVLDAPSSEELIKMQTEGECSGFRKRLFSARKENLIEDEDQLLFHRMLALFFWPAIFTKTKPDLDKVHLSEELAKEKELSTMKLPDRLFPTHDQLNRKDKLSTLNIEESEILLKKLESVKKVKDFQYKTVYIKPEVPVTMDDLKQRVYKKDIIQLKRSLIMRKAWSKRKQGILPTKEKKPAQDMYKPRSARLAARLKRQKEDVVNDEEDPMNDMEDVEQDGTLGNDN